MINKDNLFNQILKILMDRDPIGLGFVPDNEYASEANSITEKLYDGIKKDDLQKVIYSVFVRWFGKSTAGDKEKYLVIAEDILKLIS